MANRSTSLLRPAVFKPAMENQDCNNTSGVIQTETQANDVTSPKKETENQEEASNRDTEESDAKIPQDNTTIQPTVNASIFPQEAGGRQSILLNFGPNSQQSGTQVVGPNPQHTGTNVLGGYTPQQCGTPIPGVSSPYISVQVNIFQNQPLQHGSSTSEATSISNNNKNDLQQNTHQPKPETVEKEIFKLDSLKNSLDEVVSQSTGSEKEKENTSATTTSVIGSLTNSTVTATSKEQSGTFGYSSAQPATATSTVKQDGSIFGGFGRESHGQTIINDQSSGSGGFTFGTTTQNVQGKATVDTNRSTAAEQSSATTTGNYGAFQSNSQQQNSSFQFSQPPFFGSNTSAASLGTGGFGSYPSAVSLGTSGFGSYTSAVSFGTSAFGSNTSFGTPQTKSLFGGFSSPPPAFSFGSPTSNNKQLGLQALNQVKNSAGLAGADFLKVFISTKLEDMRDEGFRWPSRTMLLLFTANGELIQTIENYMGRHVGLIATDVIARKLTKQSNEGNKEEFVLISNYSPCNCCTPQVITFLHNNPSVCLHVYFTGVYGSNYKNHTEALHSLSKMSGRVTVSTINGWHWVRFMLWQAGYVTNTPWWSKSAPKCDDYTLGMIHGILSSTTVTTLQDCMKWLMVKFYQDQLRNNHFNGSLKGQDEKQLRNSAYIQLLVSSRIDADSSASSVLQGVKMAAKIGQLNVN